MAKEGGGWGAYMAKTPPYGQKRDGHPLREGRPPLAIPNLRGPTWPKKGRGAPPSLAIPWGAYMAKEREVGEPIGPSGHPPPTGGKCLHGHPQRMGRPLWPKRGMAIPLAIP
jgi:hypothetical protein